METSRRNVLYFTSTNFKNNSNKKYIYMESRKMYWWTYLQGRNRDADVENGLVDTVKEGEGGMNWESSIERYPLPCVK